MLIFLFSAIFMVSAGEDITVTGFVENNVLLPCDCSGRNLEAFSWQKDEKMHVTKYNNDNLNFGNNYINRVKTYFRGDSRNCSILLTNITLDDQGQYRCIFNRKERYTYINVDLNVCGSDICQYTQSTPSGGKVYHCDVRQHCREPEITWILDGETPIDSPTINIFNTSNLDKQTGPYYFYSTLKTEHKFTSEPQCNVTCPETEPEVLQRLNTQTHQDPNHYLRTLCKFVPIVLILGFLLIWCRRRGTSHRLPSE